MHDALPHASVIGFTGTPIELADANTRAVFGDYISVYDIQRAVQDGATAPIYYESRLVKRRYTNLIKLSKVKCGLSFIKQVPLNRLKYRQIL